MGPGRRPGRGRPFEVTYYVRVGDVPAKRHTVHRDDSGARLAEELMGEEGFSGASSLLYHRHSPSAITAVEAVTVARSPLSANDPLLPWHLRAPELTGPANLGSPTNRGGQASLGAENLGGRADPVADQDLITGRTVLLATSTVTMCWAAATATSELYRNAAGDELVYVQSGRATMESVFGRLPVGPGDYVVVPASTTHRWVLDGAGPVQALVLEAAGHVDIPERYRTPSGQLREGAPYCERDLRPPQGPLLAESLPAESAPSPPSASDDGSVPVLVRSRSGWSRHFHAHHPFDVVGWDGCVYPFALSIHDFEPITGRIHQPPPVHQTFSGPGFVVCSFVPRLFDFDPDAVKVPYHHANVDSDEVLFYSAGDFMSRKGTGIAAGSVTLHPAGFVHGPQPGSVQASMSQDRTEETAVMVDTFEPLRLSDAARSVADTGYPWTWARTD